MCRHHIGHDGNLRQGSCGGKPLPKRAELIFLGVSEARALRRIDREALGAIWVPRH